MANRAARSLVTQRAGSVAFLLSETQDRFFEDPNFTTLLRGCTTALAEQDLPLVLITAGNEAERRRVAPFLSAHHVDGVLLFSSHRGNPMIDVLRRAELPFVCCGKPLGRRGAVSSVAADDREGARNMVRYLIESGRTRIATITGPRDTPGGLERLAGYRETLAEHGIAYDKRLVATGDYSRESGESCMHRLLTRAPDDIAVGGFDDSPVAVTTRPRLTTILWTEVGDRAAAIPLRWERSQSRPLCQLGTVAVKTRSICARSHDSCDRRIETI
ncbi:LacI family DNA-binding transcriptional regulator [Amycolatopsis lurida]